MGPFRVLEKLGRIAYYLNVSLNWHIHPVFPMAQLEPAPPLSPDLFQQLHPDYPLSVFVEEDTDFSQSFEVKRLINRRIIKMSRGTLTLYLVCWVGYVPEFDQWYSL